MSQRTYDNGVVLWTFADLERIRGHFPHITSKRGLVDTWFRLRAVGILEAAGCRDCCTGLFPTTLAGLGRIHNSKALVRLARQLLRLSLPAKEADRHICRWRQSQKDRRLLTTALRMQPK